MNDVVVLVKGVLAGVAISAPVGPVSVLCISRTVARGRMAGIVSGLGAATVDTVYGAIAAFSISFIIGFLIGEEFWIRLFGGILLFGIGVRYYVRKPGSLREGVERDSAHSGYVTAFLLNLTNPTVVLSFLAVLTALGLRRHKSWLQELTLVIGIFVGAMVWWIALATITGHYRDRLDARAMQRMSRLAGVAIGGFGVATLILAVA